MEEKIIHSLTCSIRDVCHYCSSVDYCKCCLL